MRTIPAGEFKTKCLAIMDEVQLHREPVLITKRGKPVAQLTPVVESQSKTKETGIFGFMHGKAEIIGDITQPIVVDHDWGTIAEWDELNEDFRRSKL